MNDIDIIPIFKELTEWSPWKFRNYHLTVYKYNSCYGMGNTGCYAGIFLRQERTHCGSSMQTENLKD